MAEVKFSLMAKIQVRNLCNDYLIPIEDLTTTLSAMIKDLEEDPQRWLIQDRVDLRKLADYYNNGVFDKECLRELASLAEFCVFGD